MVQGARSVAEQAVGPLGAASRPRCILPGAKGYTGIQSRLLPVNCEMDSKHGESPLVPAGMLGKESVETKHLRP